MDHAHGPRDEIQTKSLGHKPPALTWKGHEHVAIPYGGLLHLCIQLVRAVTPPF